MNKATHVAVAILQKENGDFLLSSRPQGKSWAGWWEFPGGKIELNETPEQALIRELQEELAIVPTQIQPWLQRRFDYPATHDSPAKTVHLHFFFIMQWRRKLIPQEGQSLSWQAASHVNVKPILPANAPIIHALSLPNVYAISNAAEMGEAAFFDALKQKLQQGLKLIQVRERKLDPDALVKFSTRVLALARPVGAKVIINQDVNLSIELGLDGVHLPSRTLLQLDSKPNGLIVAASCHNAVELAHAQALDLDFVTLSPVTETASHPDVKPLGWHAFSELIAYTTVPVYALGGMGLDDLPHALLNGARGIAMQRAVWGVIAP